MIDILDDKDYVVIDDIISKEEQDFVEKYILRSGEFHWMANYSDSDGSAVYSTVGQPELMNKFSDNKNIHEGPQMTQWVFNNNEIQNFNSWNTFVRHMIDSVKKHHDIKEIVLRRCKINLQFNLTGMEEGKFNTPHLDCQENHIAMIYFVNDSDGDTYLFKDEELNILTSVSPKKGRAIFFKGDILHTGSHPIKNKVRCVINFNFQ
jgi:NADH:ubiquinone oxidoreductase subunit